MKIGIDIDGTVTENFQLIKDLSCSYFNKHEHDIKEWDWDFCKVFDISSEQAQNFWNLYEKQIYTLPGPKPHAVEVISKLACNNEIIYITARSEAFAAETTAWLKNKGIYFNKLFTTKDKLKICLDENINVMIDDSPEYVAIANNIPLLMFDYPYNKHVIHPSITKINSWLDVLMFLS